MKKWVIKNQITVLFKSVTAVDGVGFIVLAEVYMTSDGKGVVFRES